MSERRFGILIGSSRFPDEPKLETLRFPDNDVDGLNEILTSRNHGQFTQTFVLKNKLHHEILLKINQTLREADKQDLVLIYYSGHGKLNPAGRLHLATANTIIGALEATSISVATLKEYVDISSSNKIALILDCCFSGAAGLEFAKGGVDDQLNLISGGRGTYIMTASTGIQVAQEKESDQYGVFTKHVIEGIKSGEADLDSNGRITMGELYRYVHDRVLDEGFQEPMKWDLNVRGELVIAHSGKTPRKERRKKILKLLFDLAGDGVLPDEILDKARQVIALEPDQPSEEALSYDNLLDQLLDGKILVGEFISRWYKVKKEKDDLKRKDEEERRRKEQQEHERKAEEEKRRKEKEELKRKAEDERKRTEAEAERKAEEERKKKEIEAKRRTEKAKIEPDEPGSVKIKPSESKPDIKAPTESIPPKTRKTSKTLKFGIVAGVFVLLIAGIGWWFFQQQGKEVRREMENLNRQILNLERAVVELDRPEQIEGLTRQRDTLSRQVEDFSEQATKIGLEPQLIQLIDRLNQIQIQLAHKEEELIAARKGKVFVESAPENAIVEILNIDRGFRQGMELEPGKYHIEVSLRDHEPQDRWIELGPGEERQINFALEKIAPQVARLQVETVPEDATVRILNIKPKFSQGMELEPGSYHVEVAAEGYETQREWVDLAAGHEEPIRVELAKIRTIEPPPPQKAIMNSIDMKFVMIPAGKFVMGSPSDEPERDYGERQHVVNIDKKFYLQTTEVSQGQWQRFMGDNLSEFKDCGADCPVQQVSWNDAQEFISKLNQMEDTNKYRLPTEAEWEYACRAETTTPFFTGECISTDQANYNGKFPMKNCPKGEYRKKTVKVGSFRPNDWGLYDMHGNVWEWVQDWYGGYPSHSVDDPKGPDNGVYRVLRGGSWDDDSWSLRSALRFRMNPGSRSLSSGFRVARDF